MPKIHSISIKKSSFVIPFWMLLIPYFCQESCRRGHTKSTCCTVWTPVLHLHKRSSSFEFGYRLSFSILRLWDPVRYLVHTTRWNSNLCSYSGDLSSGLTIRYVPSFESASSLAACSIFSLIPLIKFLFSVSLHVLMSVYKVIRFL